MIKKLIIPPVIAITVITFSFLTFHDTATQDSTKPVVTKQAPKANPTQVHSEAIIAPPVREQRKPEPVITPQPATSPQPATQTPQEYLAAQGEIDAQIDCFNTLMDTSNGWVDWQAHYTHILDRFVAICPALQFYKQRGTY